MALRPPTSGLIAMRIGQEFGPPEEFAASDAEVQRAAAGASYAGEPDPYRKPAEDADGAEDAAGAPENGHADG